MDNLNLNKHISGQFNAELESIRTQVMTMGGHFIHHSGRL
jgi:phosphate transport system protein